MERRIRVCLKTLAILVVFNAYCGHALYWPDDAVEESRNLITQLRKLRRNMEKEEAEREMLRRNLEREEAEREMLRRNLEREEIVGELLSRNQDEEEIEGEPLSRNQEEEEIEGELLSRNLEREEVGREVLSRNLEREEVGREVLSRNLEREEAGREVDNAGEEELQRQARAQRVHAREFLEKFGYIPAFQPNVSHDPVNMTKAIMKMQHMYGINETGVLDNKTMQMMSEPRCGMPDAIPEEYVNAAFSGSKSPNSLIAENFYVPGYKWKKMDLTWKLKNYHPRLSADVTRRAIYSAFKYWSDVSGLTFQETTSKADINMEFVARVHSDGQQNAFDGPSGVLAHAFYPESGEAHFDSDEYWTDGVREGINFMTVVAHELGHALGVGHTNIQGALMYPSYQGYDPNFKLSTDDIQAIQTLYGGPRFPTSPTVAQPTVAPTTTTTTATKRSTPPTNGQPNTCDLIYKAVTQTHDYRVYVYNGRWMWRLSEWGLDQGFPVTISTHYQNNPPESITAAIFSWKTYYTYFFKGKQVWKYYGFQTVQNKTIETNGYPENPKAAFAASDDIIYLLKDGRLFRFDENLLDVVDPGNPVSFDSVFPRAPSRFDSLLRLRNDPHVYFFDGPNYYKYSDASRSMLDGYPKSTAAPWMGPPCGGKAFSPK